MHVVAVVARGIGLPRVDQIYRRTERSTAGYTRYRTAELEEICRGARRHHAPDHAEYIMKEQFNDGSHFRHVHLIYLEAIHVCYPYVHTEKYVSEYLFSYIVEEEQFLKLALRPWAAMGILYEVLVTSFS